MRHAKGISAVIAVVLLLLVTVSIIWVFSTWMTATTKTATEKTGKGIKKKLEVLNIEFAVKAGYNSASDNLEVSVTNTGTEDIDLSKVKVFLKGLQQAISSGNSGTLAPGDTAKLVVSNNTAACGEVVTVSYSGVERSAVVEC